MPDHPQILPDDPYDQALVRNVAPPDWVNPTPAGAYNLVAIGGGTAGLVSAAGAALLGAKVALVERALMGGDCLVTGCVPSKALLRAARAAYDAADARRFGVAAGEGGAGPVRADFAAAMERMRAARAQISPHDAARHFRDDRAVEVFFGDARFTGPDTVEVKDRRGDVTTLRFRRAVIATGGRPAVPPIPGLGEAGFLTNETVFNLTALPARLAVIGGGPVGCELAQAFARLGSRVTIVHRGTRLLGREDPDAAKLLHDVLARDGVDVRLETTPSRVEIDGPVKRLHLARANAAATDVVEADAILVGAGRSPNVQGLGLEAAGVRYDAKRGVEVDDFLRTSNRRVYAAGDVCQPLKFTHLADASARAALQNALLGLRKRVSRLIVPACTYTDPEIAHTGLGERELRERGIPADTYAVPLASVDRAVTDGETEGFVKIRVTRGGDRILGATIVARHAGEMISQVTTAMIGGIGLKSLARVIHPYPTQAEAIRKAADACYEARLSPLLLRAVKQFLAWRR